MIYAIITIIYFIIGFIFAEFDRRKEYGEFTAFYFLIICWWLPVLVWTVYNDIIRRMK